MRVAGSSWTGVADASDMLAVALGIGTGDGIGRKRVLCLVK